MCDFLNDTATTEIYTLALHDALPIFDLVQRSTVLYFGCWWCSRLNHSALLDAQTERTRLVDHASSLSMRSANPPNRPRLDRQSTRLNSSHANISYAVFSLKKMKKIMY